MKYKAFEACNLLSHISDNVRYDIKKKIEYVYADICYCIMQFSCFMDIVSQN